MRAEPLRQRAARNRRSLQRELVSILEAAVGRGPVVSASSSKPARAPLTIEQLAEVSQRLFPTGTQSSVSYLRRLRDSR